MSIDGVAVGVKRKPNSHLGQSPMENIVDVGRYDQPGDRQAHLLGSSRRRRRRNSRSEQKGHFAVRRAQAHRSIEIVDDLDGKARPVDRIDGGELETLGKSGVIEHRFDQRLRRIEIAHDCDIVDIGREHGRHLPPLHIRYATLRMEHEDVHMGAICHGLDGGGPRIAGGCTNDGKMLVPLGEEALEQEPKELEGDILECQSPPMEQFEQILTLIELQSRMTADG